MLCILFAYGIDTIAPGIGIWAYFSAGGLFVYNKMIFRRTTHQIQDAVDAQAQGEFIMHGAGGASKQITNMQGFSVQSPVTGEKATALPWYKPANTHSVSNDIGG